MHAPVDVRCAIFRSWNELVWALYKFGGGERLLELNGEQSVAFILTGWNSFRISRCGDRYDVVAEVPEDLQYLQS